MLATGAAPTTVANLTVPQQQFHCQLNRMENMGCHCRLPPFLVNWTQSPFLSFELTHRPPDSYAAIESADRMIGWLNLIEPSVVNQCELQIVSDWRRIRICPARIVDLWKETA
jgi:hypothetical protein